MDGLMQLFQEKETKRFKLKVGVFALIMEKGRVLLLRRFQTGTQDGMYVLPMGGHDGKERLTDSIIREVREEVNLEVTAQNMSVCHVIHRLHTMPFGYTFEQIDVFFKISAYDGFLQNNEPDKCDEVAFYPLERLPDETAPFIRHALSKIQMGEFYSEFGWE